MITWNYGPGEEINYDNINSHEWKLITDDFYESQYQEGFDDYICIRCKRAYASQCMKVAQVYGTHISNDKYSCNEMIMRDILE